MIRVLTFAPNVYDGTSFYRLGGVIPYMSKEYSDLYIRDMSHTKEIDWADYAGFDVAIFQRPFINAHINTINMLKMMGLKVIIDYDDDVLNLPIHNPYYANYKTNEDTIRKIVSLVDHVWVSTQSLMDEFVKYNKSIEIIPNAHNDYLFPVNKKRKFNVGGNKVAYRGGSTHEVDMYSYINDWEHIVNKNQNYNFYFLGARFPYLEMKCGDNYLIIPGAHILDYFHSLNDINPNIFIYPLEDTKFNRGKSNISWIEATYAGAAVLGPSFHSDFKKPGVLNFGESFINEFDLIKSDAQNMRQMNEDSWNYIQENLLLSNINHKRYNSIVELQNRK